MHLRVPDHTPEGTARCDNGNSCKATPNSTQAGDVAWTIGTSVSTIRLVFRFPIVQRVERRHPALARGGSCARNAAGKAPERRRAAAFAWRGIPTASDCRQRRRVERVNKTPNTDAWLLSYRKGLAKGTRWCRWLGNTSEFPNAGLLGGDGDEEPEAWGGDHGTDG